MPIDYDEATVGKTYESAYRSGWNDALAALAAAACDGCDDAHWLRIELKAIADRLKRK